LKSEMGINTAAFEKGIIAAMELDHKGD